MHIVCPHCTTSYAINPATLGEAGRTVRCSRCKEVWLARPEDAVEALAPMPAMAAAGQSSTEADAAAEWEAMAREEEAEPPPVVDSPSISADWPAEGEGSEEGSKEGSQRSEADWPSVAREDAEEHEDVVSKRLFGLFPKLFTLPRFPRIRSGGLPMACAAMGALVLALIIWRVDVVRLLPQTEMFYKMVGLQVNLRGLLFKDV